VVPQLSAHSSALWCRVVCLLSPPIRPGCDGGSVPASGSSPTSVIDSHLLHCPEVASKRLGVRIQQAAGEETPQVGAAVALEHVNWEDTDRHSSEALRGDAAARRRVLRIRRMQLANATVSAVAMGWQVASG
jgi:hypothetical protein